MNEKGLESVPPLLLHFKSQLLVVLGIVVTLVKDTMCFSSHQVRKP